MGDGEERNASRTLAKKRRGPVVVVVVAVDDDGYSSVNGEISFFRYHALMSGGDNDSDDDENDESDKSNSTTPRPTHLKGTHV